MNFTTAPNIDPEAVIKAADQAVSDINRIREQIGQVIYGQ